MNARNVLAVLLTAIGIAGLTGCGADAPTDAGTASEGASNAEITNNQEEGVDEGDIVKNVGDHLLVLRHGRLFAVDVGESGEMHQTDYADVPRNGGLVDDVWYDEMLVKGDDVYVIGYRYGVELQGQIVDDYSSGATEINHFTLDEDGELTREETVFFESSDYYSFSDYSSRMIDDKLVFYMPFYHRSGGIFGLFTRGRRTARLPRMLEHVSGNQFRRKAQVLDRSDIVEFSGDKGGDTLHTVVSCDLSGGEMKQCDARAVRGGWWGTRYTTVDDVYLWSEEKVYALSLTDGDVTAHAVHGWPRDQFSFDYDGENLNVVVTHDVSGRRNETRNRIEMLQLPREEFDEDGDQSLSGKTRALTGANENDSAWIQANRFIDDEWVLVSRERWNEESEEYESEMIAHNVRTRDTHALPIDGWIQRIEPLSGVGALVSSQGRWNSSRSDVLTLQTVTFDDGVALADALELDGTREGEWRSHGFFFKPDTDDGGGTFGLPVIGNGSGWWGSGSSNIAFFDVTPGARVSLEGTVSSASEERFDECLTSCSDWYGNTRPIFLFERIYALMGAEIAEVELGDRQARVVQRLEMTAPAPMRANTSLP